MKKFIFTIVTLLVCFQAQAQDRYEANYAITFFAYDSNTLQPDFSKPHLMNKNWDFVVVSEKKSITLPQERALASAVSGQIMEYYLIQFPKWKANTNSTLQNYWNNTFVGTGTLESQPLTWVILASDLTDKSATKVVELGGWPTPQIGTLLFPVKMRFGNKSDSVGTELNAAGDTITSFRKADFSTDLTLGSSFGFKFRISKYHERYLMPVFAAGISTINIDSSSIHGAANADDKVAAFTIAGGLVYMFERGQIGVVFGADYLGKNLASSWDYQGKPWIGLGIGLQIFTVNEGEDKSAKKQK